MPKLECNLPTKCKILHQTASIFDPIGFLTLAVLPMKLFIQELWEKNRLRGANVAAVSIIDSWSDVEVRIPRKASDTINTTEIHTFVDASQKVYALARCNETLYGGSDQIGFDKRKKDGQNGVLAKSVPAAKYTETIRTVEDVVYVADIAN
ncbi:unnamed protein product [Gongylonema pulchrum]|uniref:Protein-serine/threonine phosphatase n=1 Tax=Gongylonema pulchrum TaxID=637853 RepID=A0A183E5J5_9BILA|nr:unnamed protein product [Gongylonema pulchrum]